MLNCVVFGRELCVVSNCVLCDDCLLLLLLLLLLFCSLPFPEQYDTFVKFSHDQVERRLAESAFSCKS